MPKAQNSLQAVLERQAQPPVAVHRQPREQSKPGKFYRPSRDGKRLIAGHFTPKVAKQLKLLAVEEDTSVQALLEEAIELLFVKKGRGHIGRV
jgi:hypothetical protein